MILGNQSADSEAKAGMSAHYIDWEEYKHADDRTYIAMIVQLLIKDVWEKHFATDMEAKLGPELDRDDLEEWWQTHENLMEVPPEVEEQFDPWAAEQEPRVRC